jgi:hypothetical protein
VALNFVEVWFIEASKINMAIAGGQSISEGDWLPDLSSMNSLKFDRKML